MATKIAKISGLKFGTAAESSYTIIVTNIQETNSSEETTCKNEAGEIVATNIEGVYGELTCNFRIKGATHLAAQALIGTIVNFDDTEFPGDYIVTGNSKTRQEGQWMQGSMTARNYGSGFTTTTTTTTTTGA